MPFNNRSNAGAELGQQLIRFAANPNVLVLGAGAAAADCGMALASKLGLRYQTLPLRKMTLPGDPEAILGAITTGGIRVLEDDLIRFCGITPQRIAEIAATAEKELTAEPIAARDGSINVRCRTVILVSDAMISGLSMRAAVRFARQQGAAKVIVAVPVSSAVALDLLSREADEMIHLGEIAPFADIRSVYAGTVER